MGDEQGRPASRAAEYDALFGALPPAGSDAYWQRIEHPQAGSELPLEVLARCIRERLSMHANDHAGRVFAVLLGRIDKHVSAWARARAATIQSGNSSGVASDLMQGCYLRLWEELCKSAPLFILENFMQVLHRIEQHTVHAQFEQSGDWQRPGVTHPTRIPRREMDSIDAGHKDSDGTSTPLDFADPAVGEVFAAADLRIDLQEVLKHISQVDRELLYYAFVHGWTQQEIADHFHITDRTVRNRLDRILKTLRRYLDGGEGHHGE